MAPGRIVYTAMLNAAGGIESDCTVIRQAGDSFLIVTGSAQGVRDADWLRRHVGEAFVTVDDVTSAWSTLSVMGPKSAALLARVSADAFTDAAFPIGLTREVDVGLARVRAARMSYIGGPGYELYVPMEMAAHVYDEIAAAGADLGLRDGGYYAIDALRIEAGRRAFGAELGPDETPLQAGLMHAVKLDKPGGFLGRDALLREREKGPSQTARRAARSTTRTSMPGAASRSCATARRSAKSPRRDSATGAAAWSCSATCAGRGPSRASSSSPAATRSTWPDSAWRPRSLRDHRIRRSRSRPPPTRARRAPSQEPATALRARPRVKRPIGCFSGAGQGLPDLTGGADMQRLRSGAPRRRAPNQGETG